MAAPPWTIVGSEEWRQRHFTHADGHLTAAEQLLEGHPDAVGVARAEALINLARARHNAIETAYNAS